MGLKDKIQSSFSELTNYAVELEKNSQELKDILDLPLINSENELGSTHKSELHDEINERINEIESDLSSDLIKCYYPTKNITLKDIISACTEYYELNQKKIDNLEDQLQFYGYEKPKPKSIIEQQTFIDFQIPLTENKVSSKPHKNSKNVEDMSDSIDYYCDEESIDIDSDSEDLFSKFGISSHSLKVANNENKKNSPEFKKRKESLTKPNSNLCTEDNKENETQNKQENCFTPIKSPKDNKFLDSTSKNEIKKVIKEKQNSPIMDYGSKFENKETKNTNLIDNIIETEMQTLPIWLRNQVSLENLNQTISFLNQKIENENKTLHSENDLKVDKDLEFLGTKIRSILLSLIQLKRLESERMDTETMYKTIQNLN